MALYAETRKNNRDRIIQKARNLRLGYHKFCQSVSQEISDLNESSRYLDQNRQNCELLIDKIEKKVLRREQIQKWGFNPSRRVYTMQELRHERKARVNQINREIENLQSEILSYVAPLEHGSKRLVGLLKRTHYYLGDTQEAQAAIKAINEYVNAWKIPNDVKANFEVVKEIDVAIGNYLKLLKRSKVELPQSEKVAVAKVNLDILEGEISQQHKSKSEYFDTFEGKVLAFATYDLETRKESDDENYLEFLLEQKQNKFLELGGSLEEILHALQNLHESGRLDTNDFIYLRATFEKDLKKSPTSKPESIEDINTRSEILAAETGLSLEESSRIARLISFESLETILDELIPTLGPEVAKALIQNNPNLLLMTHAEGTDFLRNFREVRTNSLSYGLVDFDPLQSPENFSGLDALRATNYKLSNLIAKVRVSDNQTYEVDLTERDRLNLDLEREGLNSALTMDIIMRGPRFGAERFIGGHRISRGNWEENSTRHCEAGYNKKEFKRIFDKLVKENVILSSGGYSLNPHPSEVENEVLKRLLSYALAQSHSGS